jgi:AraC-like DNA-binding protein
VERHEISPDFAAAWEAFEQRLADHVTPTWLAARSKLSPQRLARLTKRLFGLVPQQLITKTRVTAAATLLRETDESISEITQACGFFDQSAFARSFRSATGVTPTEYRKVHRRTPKEITSIAIHVDGRPSMIKTARCSLRGTRPLNEERLPAVQSLNLPERRASLASQPR